MQSDMENTEENLQENIENEDLNGVKEVIVKRKLSKMTTTIDEVLLKQLIFNLSSREWSKYEI